MKEFEMEHKSLTHWLDIIIIIVYFLIVLGIGLWTLFRQQRGNVQSYFLAGRRMKWYAVGASLYSSNIGSEHFIGLAGAGAVAGISLILFEWLPIYSILLLGWLFIPVYVSAGVYTLPEYIGKRYNSERLRIYLSITALVLYIIAKLAVSMFSGALIIQQSLGWNTYISLTGLLIITGLYTMLGGLTAVMYTDLIQTIIMLCGATAVSVISFKEIGGYGNLQRLYFNSIPNSTIDNTTCGLPRPDAFHVFLDPVTGDQPWPGLVLQATLGGLWYWDNDQVIVQRVLASQSLSHAKGGSLLAGVLKLIPLFIMVFPGMISRILYTGARGLLMAVMLSAIMSSLTSIFNSASTLFTMDIWKKIRKSSSQKELLIVGRIFVTVMCVMAILWLPMIKIFQSGRLFSYINAVQGYIGSTLGVTFLFSVFWKKTTEAGAFYGFVISQCLGVIRLVVEAIYPEPPCGETDTRPMFLSKIHYLYFIQIQQLLAIIVTVAISLCTTPQSDDQLIGLTWWTKYQPFDKDDTRTTKTALEPVCEQCSNSDRISQHENIELMCAHLSFKDKSETDEKNKTGNVFVEPLEKVTTKMKKNQQSSKPKYMWIKTICGLEDVVGVNMESMELFNAHATRTFLTQNKRTSNVLTAIAVFLMVIVAFIMGYYN